jgi:hypothetical protein
MIIPCFARNILQIGAIPEEISSNRHPGVEKVWRLPLNSSLPGQKDVAPGVQCVLVAMPEIRRDKIDAMLKKADELAPDPAQIVFFFTEKSDQSCEIEVEELLSSRGWMLYHSGLIPSARGRNAILTVIAIRNGYNPVAHARQIASADRPDCAIDVLNAVPEDLMNDIGLITGLALERQRFYFQWQQLRSGKESIHAMFSKARCEFAQITALAPFLTDSYRLHADYWSFLGRADMAARVMRSLDFVCNKLEQNKQLGKIESVD